MHVIVKATMTMTDKAMLPNKQVFLETRSFQFLSVRAERPDEVFPLLPRDLTPSFRSLLWDVSHLSMVYIQGQKCHTLKVVHTV